VKKELRGEKRGGERGELKKKRGGEMKES